MNTITRWLIVSMMTFVMMAVAAPAFSGQATQIFSCEQDDDVSEDDLRAIARDWLAAAKKMKGGANIDAYLYFPVAVNSLRESDFFFVIVAPSFAEWGVFWDGYQGSAAAKADAQNRDKVACPNSAVWESEKVVLKAN